MLIAQPSLSSMCQVDEGIHEFSDWVSISLFGCMVVFHFKFSIIHVSPLYYLHEKKLRKYCQCISDNVAINGTSNESYRDEQCLFVDSSWSIIAFNFPSVVLNVKIGK